MTRALIIYPDGAIDVAHLDGLNGPDGHLVLGALVGGYIEGVSPSGPDMLPGVHGWHAYCNEDGKRHWLAANHLATFVARVWGWPVGDVLRGPVVFLGDDPVGLGEDGDGREHDVPQALIDTAWAANL